MADTVSREELEALLSAYRSAHVGGQQAKTSRTRKAVQPFEIPHSGAVSTECLRVLKRFHNEFAVAMSEAMSTLFKLPTKVEADNVEQLTRKDFRESISAPMMIVELDAEPLSREIVLAVDSSLVGQWTDFVCGGSIEEQCEPSRLTQIDLALAARVLQLYLDRYADMWPGAQKLGFEIRTVCSSESYESSAAPSEAVLLCGFHVASPHCSGRIIWCLPAAAVEAMLIQKNTVDSSTASAADFAQIMREAIGEIELKCRAVLGKARLSFAELISLDVGDVIKTNATSDSEAKLFVGDIPLYCCKPRTVGRRLGVVIHDDSPGSIDQHDSHQDGSPQFFLKVA